MWPAIGAIGQVAGGLGSLAGGLSGFFNKGSSGGDNKSTPGSYRKQSKWMRRDQSWIWQNQLPMMVDAARAAGIHPLAALGMQPISANTQMLFGKDSNRGYQSHDIGRSLHGMGQGIREMLSFRNELTEAQIERIKAETELIRSKIPGQTNAPTGIPIDEQGVFQGDVVAGSPGVMVSEIPITPQKPLGVKAQKAPLEGKYIDENLRLWTGPHQETSEFLTEGLQSWKYGIMREGRSLYRALSTQFGWTRWAKNIRMDIRSMLDRATKAYPPPKGYYWAYEIDTGMPRAKRITGNNSLFYSGSPKVLQWAR